MYPSPAVTLPVEPVDVVSRRAHERFEIALPVTVEHAGRSLDGTTRNLSLGGMLAEVPGKVPLGASVSLRFHLPTLGSPLVALARVRWVDGESGLGLQFDGLRPRDVWALQQLLRPAPAGR